MSERFFFAVEGPIKQLLQATIRSHLSNPDAAWDRYCEWRKHNDSLIQADYNRTWDFALRQCESTNDRAVMQFCDAKVATYTVDRFRYVKSLRNKYVHKEYVEGTEQLADIGVVKAMLKDLSTMPHADRDGIADLSVLVDHQWRKHLQRVIEVESLGQKGDLAEVTLNEIQDAIVALHHAIVGSPRSEERPAPERSESVVLMRGVGEIAATLDRISRAAAAHHLALNQRLDTVVERLAMLPVEEHDVVPIAQEWIEEPPVEEADFGFVPTTLYRDEGVLTADEVRDRLIDLRWRIWDECGKRASADGVLRKRMLEQLVASQVTSDEELRSCIPAFELDKIDTQEWVYLPEIYRIIARMR